MTEKEAQRRDHAEDLAAAIRGVRARYDHLPRGQTAALRRCRSAGDVALEGTFWRIGDAVAHEQKGLSHVVLMFPLASQGERKGFSFGRYLRTHLGSADGADLRFRRLLDSRDRGDLDHRLRRVLQQAAADRSPVDWGILGLDILWFFAESDAVRRRWAQDFYAPTSAARSDTAASHSHSAGGAEVSS